MKYTAFEHLIAPARKHAGLSRLVIGTVAVVIGYICLTSLFFLGQSLWMGGANFAGYFATVAQGTTAQGLLTQLFCFGFLSVSLWIVLRVVHKRGFSSLIGPLSRTLHDFLFVVTALAFLTLFLVFIPAQGGGAPIVNMPYATWLALLPISVVAILVQSGSEELFFRGYLQSQLAARFKSTLAWLLVPSALFALMHFGSSAGGASYSVLLWAFLFGLTAADLTARTGNLGAAFALHLMNNLAAFLITASGPAMSGLALFAAPEAADSSANTGLPISLIEFTMIGMNWLIARLALRV
jgi:membrane protease YdiL (CAAX protease family)